MADCAAAALTILDTIGIARPVDWLGNAWGGHVGVFFAAGNPTACRSLITIATPLRVLSPPERRKVRPLYDTAPAGRPPTSGRVGVTAV